MDQFEHALGIASLAVFAVAGIAAAWAIVTTVAADFHRIAAALRGEPVPPAVPTAQPRAVAPLPQRRDDGTVAAPAIQVRR